MPALGARIRFYMFCDTSPLELDYAPDIADSPSFPRQEGTNIKRNFYESALGSNSWNYYKGKTVYWNMKWESVSETCMTNMGIICASSLAYSPHIVIYEGVGIAGIGLGSLQADVTPKGTYIFDMDSWSPEEDDSFGLYNFQTNFRKE